MTLINMHYVTLFNIYYIHYKQQKQFISSNTINHPHQRNLPLRMHPPRLTSLNTVKEFELTNLPTIELTHNEITELTRPASKPPPATSSCDSTKLHQITSTTLIKNQLDKDTVIILI